VIPLRICLETLHDSPHKKCLYINFQEEFRYDDLDSVYKLQVGRNNPYKTYIYHMI